MIYHGSTVGLYRLTWLYVALPWLYVLLHGSNMALIHGSDRGSTRLYHGFYHGSTMGLLHGFYHGCIRGFYRGYTGSTMAYHGFSVALRGSTVALPWLYHGSTMALPWLYHGSTMALPWLYHGSTVALPWLYRGSTVALGCMKCTKMILIGLFTHSHLGGGYEVYSPRIEQSDWTV